MIRLPAGKGRRVSKRGGAENLGPNRTVQGRVGSGAISARAAIATFGRAFGPVLLWEPARRVSSDGPGFGLLLDGGRSGEARRETSTWLRQRRPLGGLEVDGPSQILSETERVAPTASRRVECDRHK
jgi:hypothetical protein